MTGDARIADRPARSWRQITSAYAEPDTNRSLAQLLNTALPFLALMGALLYGLRHEVWATLVLVPPVAALLVRLFTIQHDCGHGAFFRSRWANDLLGRVIGVLTFTPYVFWRNSHAMHHATSGNLDRRGVGDIDTLTVREYLSLSAGRRLAYRLYRHPLVMFGIGPAYQFLIRHRIPTGNPFQERRIWFSILGTNAAIVVLAALLVLTVGLRPFVLGYGPVILLAASIGVWLFYVQHQFEETYWRPDAQWDFHAAALKGCSFYDLPRVLHWVTGYIGFHHIHHLCSKVPNYRLHECFEHHPEFRDVKRLTLLSSLKCARLALWDEEQGRLVSFRQIRQGCRPSV
jgi:acyl-lipid omega-6 desaturase (Delta-12 desaturase)